MCVFADIMSNFFHSSSDSLEPALLSRSSEPPALYFLEMVCKASLASMLPAVDFLPGACGPP